MFSLAYSLVRGFLCRKQTCTVTDTPLDGRPSVDSTSSSSHRPIARYRPTVVLIAAGRRSVHSMRWSQILADNPDFCLPRLHSTPPLGKGGGSRRYIAMSFGTDKLEWCGYPTVKNFWRYVYSFWHNPRTWRTHTHRHRMTAKAALA